MREKVKNLLALVLFILLQVVFIISLLAENHDNYLIVISLVLISTFFLFHHSHISHDKHNFTFEDIFTVLFTLIGTLATFYLRQVFGFSIVISAALVGFIASYLPSLFRKTLIIQSIPVSMYCGAFAGMSSALISSSWVFMIMAGTLTGLILISTKHIMNGYGGKLGTVAFGGVILTTYLYAFIEW